MNNNDDIPNCDDLIIITNHRTGSFWILQRDNRNKNGTGRIVVKDKDVFEKFKFNFKWAGAQVFTEEEIKNNNQYSDFYKEYVGAKRKMAKDDKIFREMDDQSRV
jgi:hypothetical protein